MILVVQRTAASLEQTMQRKQQMPKALYSVHHSHTIASWAVHGISPGEGERSRFLAAMLPTRAPVQPVSYPLAAERSPGPPGGISRSPLRGQSRTYNPTRTIQLPYVTQRIRNQITDLNGLIADLSNVPPWVPLSSHNPRRAKQCDHLAGAADGDRIREETAEGRCLKK